MNEKFIALLRGINVGGKNIIKMTELKTCFEQMHFENVKTYIQSGNVVFETAEKDTSILSEKISQSLLSRFNYTDKVFLIRAKELHTVINQAPAGFGSQPDLYRYDVIFLSNTVSSSEILDQLKINNTVDQVAAGDGVLYFSRLSSMSSQSQMTKMIKTSVYKQMTIRNWNTTTKLAIL